MSSLFLIFSSSLYFINSNMLSHLLSIMITGCTNIICGLHFISFLAPLTNQFWSCQEHDGYLVGSRINCIKIFSFICKTSYFKLFFVSVHSLEKSCTIFFLSTAKPGHVYIPWQAVSSTPDSLTDYIYGSHQTDLILLCM